MSMSDEQRVFSDWLKAAVAHAGMTQAELAEALAPRLPKVNANAISKVARGNRKLTAAELIEIARITGYPQPQISADEALAEERNKNTIPLVGYVGAGAVLVNFEPDGEIGRVPAVDGASDETVAVEIRGQSLGEMFDEWLVYYDDVRDRVTPYMLGRLCVVGLSDGNTMVKRVRQGQKKGRYDLFSNLEPPVYDVDVKWAALVKAMRPRYA